MIERHETRFVIQLLRDPIGQQVFPLHRLDKPNSGVLVFGLSAEVAKMVGEQFQEGLVSKTYLAIVRGYALESSVIVASSFQHGDGSPGHKRDVFF